VQQVFLYPILFAYYYRMKTKPILIMAAVALVTVCCFLFVGCKTAKTTEKAAIIAFLSDFNKEVKAGHAKSALAYFEDGPNQKANKTLIKMLAGKSGMNGKGKPLFKVSLDIDKAGVDFTNPQLVVAVVAAEFKHDSLAPGVSHINFTLHKSGGKQYKIVAAKVDDFSADYALYQNKVINATVPETELYSAETLAAFKIAEQLKTRYDSVLWFQHVDKKTWFYVVKGTLPENFYWQDPEKPASIDYKMGLVGPDLKEIVPVEYDMVHNIGGTIDSLIEVEKGGKKGLYNMAGKLVVPVTYDLILPLKDNENLAVLKNGEDYTYLNKQLATSEAIADFKIADVLPRVKYISNSYTLSEKSYKSTMEYNDRNMTSSLVIAPSYLVEWQMLSKFVNFPNPLRKTQDEEEGQGSRSIDVKYNGAENDEGNWFQSAFYSVVNDYLGGRGGLYETKNVLVVDKKHNKVMGFEADTYFGEGEGGGALTGDCNQNSIRAINDSLFEYKTTAILEQDLFDKNLYIEEGPYYNYLKLVNGKLVTLKTARIFPTQFIKLDDSYLSDCYMLTTIAEDYDKRKHKTIDHASPEILQVMKNEIYASYKYKFKSERWDAVFQKYRYNGADTVLNDNVDDSLTAIDKYNIEFLNRKLQIKKPAVAALR
jgi:hypothetical protein